MDMFHRTYRAAMQSGILLPTLLNGAVETNDELDAQVAENIRTLFAFLLSMEFVHGRLRPEQFISWPELLPKIPELISKQVHMVCSNM